MADVFATHGVPRVVHADRGTSMTSKKIADLLADLHVVRSHSRPHVSNDNPFSEAAFKTSNTIRRSRPGSGRSSTRGRSVTRSSPRTTTNITIAAWGCTLPHLSTMDILPPRPLHDKGSGHRLGDAPGTVRAPTRAQNPATARHCVDQQARTRYRPAGDTVPSRLTPVGLTSLDKFRVHSRPPRRYLTCSDRYAERFGVFVHERDGTVCDTHGGAGSLLK